jgi:S-formylglutathione hydrolase FrmB
MFAGLASAQMAHGIVKEGLTIQSKILGKSVRYTIYLPSDYNTSERYYPVVYLLHGYSDNDMGWLQFGEINRIADEGISKGDIPPMIIAMPDGGVSFYINNFNGTIKYEDFFFKEFLPYIESTYRIRAEKRYRGISGLSMGGWGTLVYSLRHPDMFAACAAFSSAVWSDDEIINESEEDWKTFGEHLFGPFSGKARINETFKSYSPFHIIKDNPTDKFKDLRMYIDCGDDDFLTKGNCMLHIALKEMNIQHEFRVRDGAHQWSYWRSGIVEGLKFIGMSFHQF